MSVLDLVSSLRESIFLFQLFLWQGRRISEEDMFCRVEANYSSSRLLLMGAVLLELTALSRDGMKFTAQIGIESGQTEGSTRASNNISNVE